MFLSNKKIKNLEARIRELEETVDTYRRALEFYAAYDAWEPGMKYRDAEDRTVFNDPETTAVELDRGRRARSALELSAAASPDATGGSEKTVFRG